MPNKILLTLTAALAVAAGAAAAAPPAPAAPADTLRLRVMTYNLRFGELSSLEDLASHIKAFNPDFVALEEVDVHTNRQRAPHQAGKDFIAELAFRTGMFGLYGKTIEYAGGFYGIGMLSKHPYVSVDKTMLPNPDDKERRALLEAVAEVGADTLVFATTHLDVNSEQTRQAQAEFICSHFAATRHPVVLGGDFNAAPESPTIDKVMARSWLSVTNADLTFPACRPSVKIDYLFTRPMARWRLARTQTVQSTLSDHLPIVSDIEYVRQPL